MSLILPDVLGPELVRCLMEIPRELADDANVGGCGTMRVIKSLEFFQHFVAQLGHRDLHFLRPNLSQSATNDAPEHAVASAAPAASSKSPLHVRRGKALDDCG